jgi:hypothetical protein
MRPLGGILAELFEAGIGPTRSVGTEPALRGPKALQFHLERDLVAEKSRVLGGGNQFGIQGQKCLAFELVPLLDRFPALRYVLPADLRTVLALLKEKYAINTLNDEDGYPAQIGQR